METEAKNVWPVTLMRPPHSLGLMRTDTSGGFQKKMDTDGGALFEAILQPRSSTSRSFPDPLPPVEAVKEIAPDWERVCHELAARA